MTQARGYLGRLVADFETTFGSDPATAAGVILPVNSIGVKSDRNQNVAQTISGTRNPVEPFDGNLMVAGDIVVPVDLAAFWYWLKAMFGDPTTTGTGPYVHTFTVGNDQPSIVLEKRFSAPGSVITYAKCNGCKISRWQMSVGGDGELVATLGVEGAGEALSGSEYDAGAANIAINRLKHFQATLSEGGSALSNAPQVDFTVDFGLDTDQYVIGGGGVRGDIPEGLITISGNLTTLFEDTTLLNKAINGTESSLEITLTSGSYSMVITFAEVKYGRSTPPIEGPKGIRVTLPFSAYYADHADASAVKVVLTNADAHA